MERDLGGCHRIGLLLAAALTSGLLQACSDDAHLPYAWPETPYGEPLRSVFNIHYSEWRNTQEEVRAVVTEECGEDHVVARVTEKPYTGTMLHPHVLLVECGVAILPVQTKPWQVRPYLIRLRE